MTQNAVSTTLSKEQVIEYSKNTLRSFNCGWLDCKVNLNSWYGRFKVCLLLGLHVVLYLIPELQMNSISISIATLPIIQFVFFDIHVPPSHLQLLVMIIGYQAISLSFCPVYP